MLDGSGAVGDVVVHTTQGRGFTPEEIAERALDRIIYVSTNAHPVLREQAEAFRTNIRAVLVFYLKEAVRSHNTTLANKLKNVGLEDVIPLLEA